MNRRKLWREREREEKEIERKREGMHLIINEDMGREERSAA